MSIETEVILDIFRDCGWATSAHQVRTDEYSYAYMTKIIDGDIKRGRSEVQRGVFVVIEGNVLTVSRKTWVPDNQIETNNIKRRDVFFKECLASPGSIERLVSVLDNLSPEDFVYYD